MIIIGLLYIIGDNKYLKHYKTGFIKHIPEFLLPSMKPKIIDDITQDENIIGIIAGINIKPIDFENNKDLEEYIMAIKSIKPEGYSNLYIEDYKHIPKNIIDYIEKSLNMKISNGQYIRISYIPLVITEIYKLLKDRIETKETLILCKDKEMTKEIIKIISKDIKFITISGCNEKDNQEIYEYILDETGLSLFQSSNIDKILDNYSVIINLIDNYKINSPKIKRNCIIFDYGEENYLIENRDRHNTVNRIEDFIFDIKDLQIDSNEWVDSGVHSDLYEVFNKNTKQSMPCIYSGGEYYSIRDYVSCFIKLKGKL